MNTQTTAKQTYTDYLEAIRNRLIALQNDVNNAIGDGTISNNVDWADVGDLGRALEVLKEMPRIRRVK